MRVLNDAFAAFCKEHYVALSETDTKSPKVVSVSNGSLVVDVIVPISCALLPILYDIIKRKFDRENTYTVNVYETNSRIAWADKDTYKLSKKVLEEYVLKGSSLPIDEFIDTLTLSQPYRRKSIRAKIQNTKHLIESKQIPNTLKISPLKNCSKAHKMQFNKTCADLNITKA